MVYTVVAVFHAAWPAQGRVVLYAAAVVLAAAMAGLVWSGSMLTMPNVEGGAWLAAHRAATAVAAAAGALGARILLVGRL